MFRINRKGIGLTYSCPEDMDENPISDFSAISDIFLTFGKCKYVIGRELHENGKLHWHAWVYYNDKLDVKNERAFDAKGVHPNIIKPQKMWKAYCMKDGDFVANHPVPKPLIVPEIHGWQTKVVDMITEAPDCRKITWIYEREGNRGKSSLTKYLCMKHNALLLSGKAGDMKYGIASYIEKNDGITPEIIIIDVPRSSVEDGKFFISYSAIEEIKNGCFFNTKYESGMVIMNCPHILVFANEAPEAWKMSQDRWDIYSIVEQDLILEFNE